LDTARYVIAVMLLVSLPAALLLWFIIHPLVRFWRKLGPGRTYAVLSVPVAASMVGLFAARDQLLTVEFGTNVFLVALGALCMAGAMMIAVRRRRQLTYGILVGIPELSGEKDTGKLLTDGIYARIRHPRYIETGLGILGYALFSNYLTIYIACALSVPVLYLIVLLEERELRDRFGQEYEEYCRRVPRFFPDRRQAVKRRT
jgi:protein-S-isoprenylcysteine O-methyltransferase Ste14